MDFSFFLLNINFFVLCTLIFVFKEYKKMYILYFLFLVTIFYSPALYYYFGGKSYFTFNNKALIQYYYLSSFIFFVNSIFLFLKQTAFFPTIKQTQIFYFHRKSNLLKIYFRIIISLILFYIILYFNKFPLIHYIQYHEIIERPDTTGSIPFFYTMSTLMMFILPSFYFYKIEEKNKFQHAIWLLFISITMIIGGHKGIIAFFFIFWWFFILKAKINLKLILIVSLLVVIYAINKGIAINANTLDYLFSSPYRRFFVTQGACLINRLHLININFPWDTAFDIKVQVCSYIFNSELGSCSAPTFFIGDLIVKYGFFIACLLYVLVLGAIIFILKIINILPKQNLFLNWNLYMIFFLLSMAEISFSSFLRIITIVLNIVIVVVLAHYRIILKPNSNYIFTRQDTPKE